MNLVKIAKNLKFDFNKDSDCTNVFYLVKIICIHFVSIKPKIVTYKQYTVNIFCDCGQHYIHIVMQRMNEFTVIIKSLHNSRYQLQNFNDKIKYNKQYKLNKLLQLVKQIITGFYINVSVNNNLINTYLLN